MISQEMNLKEQIHHHLFSDIVNGVYTPGSILHEKNLMEKYGVSRAPIREALIQLCSEGVLRNLPKRGYEVTEISAEEIQNIIRYRISLECGFMQQYGGYIDDALIEKLEQHNLNHQQRQGEGLLLHGALRLLPGGLPKGVIRADEVEGAGQRALTLLLSYHVGVTGEGRGTGQGDCLAACFFCRQGKRLPIENEDDHSLSEGERNMPEA